MLENLLKLGGTAALSAGVMYLLYKQIIALPIFARLTKGLTFALLIILGILVWTIAVIAITDFKFKDFMSSSVVIEGGDCNAVTQGDGSSSVKC